MTHRCLAAAPMVRRLGPQPSQPSHAVQIPAASPPAILLRLQLIAHLGGVRRRVPNSLLSVGRRVVVQMGMMGTRESQSRWVRVMLPYRQHRHQVLLFRDEALTRRIC